uniref:Uncharacterized protein n=1 Tax=Timema shepardi TaxID=629360 RepID=A0A7R9AUW2_TIMSH|nr:unnamed protein product [Timema shepardi]
MGFIFNYVQHLQNELEEVTEKLSEMVARPYLRTPRSVVIQTTALARRKRHEFVRAVSKGLIPPETPPTLRKMRKRRFPGLMGMDPVDDASRREQMSHAIAASLRDLDHNNPWVKDAQGRHTNLSAIYDWPDFDSDEEDSDVNHTLAVNLLGECSRTGCARPRARNPRTSAIHDYCSLKCSRSARLGTQDDVYRVNVTTDHNMDLVIALEMSRLQMIEDEMKKRQKAAEEESKTSENSGQPSSSVASTTKVMDDQQMKLAIQLSLQESTKRVAMLHSATAIGDASLIPQIKTTINAGGDNLIANDDSSDITSPAYHKTNADLTVDYFLKSLAGRQIDLKNFNSGINMFSPEEHSDSSEVVWGCGLSKTLADKELIGCGFKPCVAEDGRFEIGDIHENGRFNDIDEYDEADSRLLKRSHSTGDLCTRGRRSQRHDGGASGDEPRYHLDSDHSSQHEEKPEDIVKRILAHPASSKAMSGRHFLLLHHHSGGSNSNAGGETSTANSEDGTSIYYGGQSSVEDTTTTSDSLNADLEVCGILGTTTEDDDSKSFKDDSAIMTSSLDKLSEHVFHKSVVIASKKTPIGFEDETKEEMKKEAILHKDLGANMFCLTSSSHVSMLDKSSFTSSLLEEHRKAFKAAGGKASGSGGLRIRICKSPNGPGSCGQGNNRQLETDSSNEYESETGIPKSPTLFISGVSISRTPEPRSPAAVATVVTSSSVVGRQSRSSSLTVPTPPSVAPAMLGSSSASLNTTLASTSEPQTTLVRTSSPVKVASPSTSSNMLTTPPPPPLLSPPESPASISKRSPKGSGSSKRRKKSKKERHKDKENTNGCSSSSKVKEINEASSAL